MDSDSKVRNDSLLWAALAEELRTTAGTDPWLDPEMVARRLVAVVRREALPSRRTWAPGDPIPGMFPDAVFDVDGFVWEHEGAGSYRMSSDGQACVARNSSAKTRFLWDALLLEEGPVTVHVPARTAPRGPA